MQVGQIGRLLCAHELAELIADNMIDAMLVKIVAQSFRCGKTMLTFAFYMVLQPCRSLGTLVWLDVGCSIQRHSKAQS